MKTNTDKVSYRFSPLAARDANTPLLSHPRKASEDTIARKTTAKLFASQANDLEAPLSGYGALCSQVTETQYFAQNDNLAPFEDAYEPADSKDMDMDAWPSDDEGNDILAGTAQPSWEDDIAIEVDDLAPATSTSALDVSSGDPLEEHTAITSAANEFTELNEFESWVLERICRAHSKGNSAVKGLRELQMRSIALADENARLNARLTQILSDCLPPIALPSEPSAACIPLDRPLPAVPRFGSHCPHSENPPCRELGEGDPLLIRLYGDVGVRNCCGREEDEGAMRKLNNELQVPEDEVPALRCVESPQHLNRAPTKHQIQHVTVPEGPHVWAKVEGCTGKN
ncbi:hypothetical protein B0H14DRAFT_3153968 [Mycena olivaceomarginata]|nr:hypothetical protein B0H14DRAFT_3153968 [Mycena olivaceomarginata]